MIYQDTTAIDAVNRGLDTPDAFYHPKHPSRLIATSKWRATDAWRGHYEMVPEAGYKVVDQDWATGDWGDAISDEHNPDATEAKLKRLEAKHGDIFVIFTPTSNVFSTGFDVLAIDRDTPATEQPKSKVIAHKTRRIEYANGDWAIQYHATKVVKYTAATGKYTLDTGGWATMTTSKRMTEHLPGGYYVYRRNWVMYVHTPDGDQELIDGMEV